MFWISSKIESAILPSRYDYDSNGYSMQNDNTMKKFTVKLLDQPVLWYIYMVGPWFPQLFNVTCPSSP